MTLSHRGIAFFNRVFDLNAQKYFQELFPALDRIQNHIFYFIFFNKKLLHQQEMLESQNLARSQKLISSDSLKTAFHLVCDF